MTFRAASLWLASITLVATSSLTGCITSPIEPTWSIHAHSRDALSPGAKTAVRRPLSDFLSAQGSTSLFFPPFPDFIAWANNGPQTEFAAVDYAGLAAAYLQTHGGPTIGTQVGGSVSERALADGRAEVTVILHTTQALSWAVGLPGDFVNDPVQFGYRQGELFADPAPKPALSSADMKVVFKNDAPGAPLPDLVNAFILGNASPAQELLSLSFYSTGTGPLHANFGVPEGTPGKLHITQTGIFHASFQGATSDGFPAEIVNLRAVGRGTGH